MHWYLDKIPVYDNNDQAVFVLLGDAGREQTGKHASGLVDKYFEANGDLGPDHEMPACPTSFDRHHWVRPSKTGDLADEENASTSTVTKHREENVRLDKIPVYDNNDQDMFVLLGDAGRELTGKHASRLVDKYFEANGDLGPDHEMPACPTSFDRHHWSNT
ncbi:hypothetical protein DY000_02024230 [Brassica cretica]|uniref:Uncharacterized protein n=1 Tax=Brassica cretica TaxID=69181 RepID=A0ABQ7EB29_BRACR|nr:hypothetical protein DY000_02024230 [Brassica cretica]